MEITTITVKYGLTHNMGNYSNIKPEVELTATLDPGDDPDEVRWELLSQARGAVHAEVDEALEADDEEPKYYAGPRFSLATITAEKLAVIFPDKGSPLPAPWDEGVTTRCAGRRLPVIMAKVVEKYPDYAILDCSDGNYERLAAVGLAHYLVFFNRERLLCIVTPSGVDRNTFPGEADWSHYPDHYFRRKDTLLDHLHSGNGLPGRNGGYHILDCTDGDLSKIPAVAPAAPEPATKKPKRPRRKKAEAAE